MQKFFLKRLVLRKNLKICIICFVVSSLGNIDYDY